MAQVRCRDASGSTGLFEDIHRTLENTGRSEGALAPRKKDADSVSTAACAVTTKTRARTAWSRRGTGRLWCVRATPRELSRGRRAARACASVPPSASDACPGEERGRRTFGARAMPSLQEMTAGKARLRNTPRAVRARRRADRSVLPPPSARAPRRASTVPVRRRARAARENRSAPSTRRGQTRRPRRTAVEPPSSRRRAT